MATINRSLPPDAIAPATVPSGPSGRRNQRSIGERFDDHLERAMESPEPGIRDERSSATDGERSVATDTGPAMRRRSRADMHRNTRAADTSSARGDSAARADAAAGVESTDEPETDAGRAKSPAASGVPVPVPVVPMPVVVTPPQQPAPSPVASLAAGPVDELAPQPGAVSGTPVVDAATAAGVAPLSGSDLPAGARIAAAGVAAAAGAAAAPPAVPGPMVAAGSVDGQLAPPGDAPAAPPESMPAPEATGQQPAEVNPSSSSHLRGPDVTVADVVAAEAATLAAPTGTSPDPTITVDAVRAGRPAVARAVRIGAGGSGAAATATPVGADATADDHPAAAVSAADETASSAGASRSTATSTPAPTSTSAFAAAVAEAEASGAGSFDDAATTRAAAAATSADITGTHRSGTRGLPVSVPSLSMDLSDEGLGPLTLQASNGAGMLHLKLTAGDRAVGELLARAGGELRRDIEAGGTVVGSLDIGHSAHEQSTGHAGSGQWSSNQTGTGQHTGQADAGRSDGRSAARRDIPPTRSRVTSGSIGAPASSRTSSLNIGTAVDSVDVRI